MGMPDGRGARIVMNQLVKPDCEALIGKVQKRPPISLSLLFIPKRLRCLSAQALESERLGFHPSTVICQLSSRGLLYLSGPQLPHP